jgi:hypothetical protein
MRARRSIRGWWIAVFVVVLVSVVCGVGIRAQPAFANNVQASGCVYNDGTLLGKSILITGAINSDTRNVNSSTRANLSPFPCTIPVTVSGIQVWMQVQVSQSGYTWTECQTFGPYVLNTLSTYWLASQTYNYCGPGYYRAWLCGAVLDGYWKTGCLFTNPTLYVQ